MAATRPVIAFRLGEQPYLSASVGWTMFPLDEADVEGPVDRPLRAGRGAAQLPVVDALGHPVAAVPGWVAGWVPPTSWSSFVDERQSLLAGSARTLAAAAETVVPTDRSL